MFNKKNARIKQLEESLAEQKRLFDIQQTGWREANTQLAAARNQIEYLVRTIRQIDDKLFSISQCTDWLQMRPRIAQLTDEMTARKVAESNRIVDLIRPQLSDVYKP